VVAITGYGLGGPVKGELVRVPEFAMGGVRVRGIVARLSLQKAGDFNTSALAGTIGSGILKRFRLTFDYPRRRMLLQQEPSRDVPDEADRSGLWLGRSGSDFEVLDVVPNSPAARSNMRKGDIVTAVDGVPTKRVDLFALREALKSPGKKAESFTIKDGRHSRVVTIALHDLIPRNTKARIGSRIGELEDEDALRLNRAVMVRLGLARAAVRWSG
jgi:hypothetical protein